MKTWLVALSVAVAGATLVTVPTEADARRLGGGKSAGMQRQMPARPTPPAQPAQPAPQNNAAAPGAAGAAAAAAPAKRSWMGPIAGLAAGLGLAALFSHFGMGAGLANFMTMLLLAIVAFAAIRWVMRRFAGAPKAQGANGLQFAGASTGADGNTGSAGWTGAPIGGSPSQAGTGFAPATTAAMPTAASAVNVPEGFDKPGFERIAKMLFIRLQAANDAREIDDLRRFTTPELFASLRLDLQDRGEASQRTDVVQLDAELIDHAEENGQTVASVRFHGLIRENPEAAAAPFDELWHFVRPADASREWAIAGITATA